MHEPPSLTRDVVERALRQHRWIVSDTARALAVSRQALYKAIARHGIELPDRTDTLSEVFRRAGRRGGGRPRKAAPAA
jgi:hypothetical protein